MKEINLISFLIGILFFGFIACKNNKTPKNITVETAVETVEAPFKKAQPMAMKIEGMVCALGCAASIEKNLNKTNGKTQGFRSSGRAREYLRAASRRL